MVNVFTWREMYHDAITSLRGSERSCIEIKIKNKTIICFGVRITPSTMFMLQSFIASAFGSELPQLITADDPNYQFIGRWAVVGKERHFDMPGCEMRATISLPTKSTVSVVLAQQHQPIPPGGGNTKNSGFEANAFVLWIDGVRTQPGHNASFDTSKITDSLPHSYPAALLNAGKHTIRMLKATEAEWNGGDPTPNWLSFQGLEIAPVETDRNTALASLVSPKPLPARKIEFLGDSITAGFCNECQTSKTNLPGDHGEAFGASWDFQIGELLDAQVHTAAWSGFGMVRNCCGGNTTMPAIFQRTLATINDEFPGRNGWNFSSWVPAALVVNLGTNDGSAATNPELKYVETYTELVLNASATYGPNLHVFLACGPMATQYCDPVNQVIQNVVSKGVKADFLDQRGFLNGTFGNKCCGHPSIDVDNAMAKHGAAFIKKALDW